MKIDLKTLSLFALTAAMPFGGQCADTLRLQSVWQEGDRDAVHTGLLSLEQFNRQGEELAAQGLRLIDVETEVINGRRGFAGLWQCAAKIVALWISKPTAMEGPDIGQESIETAWERSESFVR